jgi:hypothetical protein
MRGTMRRNEIPFSPSLFAAQSFSAIRKSPYCHLQRKIGSELKQQRMGRKRNRGPSNQRNSPFPFAVSFNSRSKSSPEIHLLLDTSDSAIDPYFSEMKRKLPRIKGDRE